MSADPSTFRFSRESKIRIDRDGHVWHEGERVTHRGLELALASWIDLDDATGRYVLRNDRDWCFVGVDHTPLVVRSVRVHLDEELKPADRDPRVEVFLSDGSTERLDLATVEVDPDGVVYATVRNARLLARFEQGPSFELLRHTELDARGIPELVLGDTHVRLRTIERGQTLLPPAPKKGPVTPR